MVLALMSIETANEQCPGYDRGNDTILGADEKQGKCLDELERTISPHKTATLPSAGV